MTNYAGPIKGLGEVVLHARDFQRMVHFYGEILGFEVAQRFRYGKMVEDGPFDAVFFKVAEGYGGHGQIFGLFDWSARRGREGNPPLLEPERSQLAHTAFEIALETFDSEKARLEQLGLEVESVEHPLVHWRSLYLDDPDGNRVELVCHDESLV